MTALNDYDPDMVRAVQLIVETMTPIVKAQALREFADEIRDDDPVAHAYAKLMNARADELDPR